MLIHGVIPRDSWSQGDSWSAFLHPKSFSRALTGSVPGAIAEREVVLTPCLELSI